MIRPKLAQRSIHQPNPDVDTSNEKVEIDHSTSSSVSSSPFRVAGICLILFLGWQSINSVGSYQDSTTPSDTEFNPVILGKPSTVSATVDNEDIPSLPSAAETKAPVRIQVGTHAIGPLDYMEKQNPLCLKLAESITDLWMAFQPEQYAVARQSLVQTLREVSVAITDGEHIDCNLSGDPARGVLWSYPLSLAPETVCPGVTTIDALRLKPWAINTKFRFPWFLQRPEIVVLDDLAQSQNLALEFVIHLGHDPETASFNNELTCPRFRTVLNKRDVYKQRLLLVGVMDFQHQARLVHSPVILNVCSRSILESDLKEAGSSPIENTVKETIQSDPIDSTTNGFTQHIQKDVTSRWNSDIITNSNDEDASSTCDARPSLSTTTKYGHVMTIANSALIQNNKVVKTQFTGPKLVFIAGLEGVGHHMFYDIGRKHTFPYLYEKLTDYLAISAWDDNSEEKYAVARANLIKAITKASSSGMDVIFLNTIWAGKPVNMYSFPWGGPKCKLKKFARVMCNIDLVELARIAESAKIDFKVVVLKRNMGSAVVSASLHRKFGTVEGVSHMLSLSWSLLRASLESLDERFYYRVMYEDFMANPHETLTLVNQFIGVTPSSPLDVQMHTRLEKSVQNRTENRWWSEMDQSQLRLTLDLTRVERIGSEYARSRIPKGVLDSIG